MKIKKSMCLILAALMISVPCVASLDSSVSAESYDDDIVDWAYSTWSDEYGRYVYIHHFLQDIGLEYGIPIQELGSMILSSGQLPHRRAVVGHMETMV